MHFMSKLYLFERAKGAVNKSSHILRNLLQYFYFVAAIGNLKTKSALLPSAAAV